MCVIIYIPKNETISQDELKAAWETNPDGAGYAIQKNNKVYFSRGFMQFKNYYEAIKDKIGKYNLLLHFRISTAAGVTQQGTHPYKKGNVTKLYGKTNQPVIAMNGSIYQQELYQHLNDTASYIKDHTNAFAVINQDILNIITSDTNSKWIVMKPDQVLLSENFIERNCKYYSNLNHLYKSYNFRSYKPKKPKENKELIKELKKPKNLNLYYDYLDFKDIYCKQGYCYLCNHCIQEAKTIKDIEKILYETFY